LSSGAIEGALAHHGLQTFDAPFGMEMDKDARQHLFVGKGFGDVVDGAQRKTVQLVFDGGARRKKDHGHIAGPRIRPQPLANL
jgi:hypothetical protein